MTSPAGGDSSQSVLKDLLLNQYQAILLLGVAGVSGISQSLTPALIWLGGQLVLLPLLDSVPAVRRLMHRRRRSAGREEADARRADLEESLNPAAARRYQSMKSLCAQIEANYQGLHGISQVYLTEQRQKLDVVLAGCLHRLVALQRYDGMLAQRSTSQIEREIEIVEKELRQPDLQERATAALKKNLELKKKLLESISEARGTMRALALELDSMSSLLEVLHQNSVSLRDPQAISQELDSIVRQSEDSQRAVREMEALLQSDSAMGISAPAADESASAQARRVRGR